MGFWFNGIARLPLVLLHARNQPKVVAICHLIELLPYLVLLYTGLQMFGLPGAAAVFTLRTLVDLVLLAYFSQSIHLLIPGFLTPVLLVGSAFVLSVLNVIGQPLWWFFITAHLLATLLWAWNAAPDSLRRSCSPVGIVNRLRGLH